MTSPIALSKPGKYGTLHLFTIRYREAGDSGCPVFDMYVWAYNQEHAEMKFFDGHDDDGWEIVSAEKKRA